MQMLLKKTLEKLSGDRIWVEPASNLNEVKALLHACKPVPIKQQLLRCGGTGDGGYLVPDDLVGIEVCISPGVSDEVGFDLEMAERGMNVYMADASVPAPPIEHTRFHFTKKFLDVYDDDEHMRLDTMCATINPSHSGDRLLQLDIEGAEYPVLLDVNDETLKRFRIMIIEFHHLTRLFGAFSFRIINATFRKLLRFHHIIHIHPNNIGHPIVRGGISVPPVMEFTFLRKDRALLDPSQILTFPHTLDRDNVPTLPPVTLPKCWI